MNINIEDFRSFLTIKKNLSSQSVRHCVIRFRVVDRWLEGRQLTKELVELFFYERKNSGQGNNTLNTYYFFFKQLQDYCHDRGIFGDFMASFKSFKKTRAKIDIFSANEINAILSTQIIYGKFHGKNVQHLDYMNITFTMFLAYTGCRFSEAADLLVEDIDLENGKVNIRGAKTFEPRTVYITDPLISRLRKLMSTKNQKDLVFVNALGSHINPSDYSEDLKKRAKMAGVLKRVFPHNFRHTYITNLLETGVPITEVATLVGHRDIQTTYSTYMHLADQTLKKAALRNPLIRRNVDPKYMLETIKETLKNYHLEEDDRFEYSYNEKNNSFMLSIKIVK